MTEIRTGGYMTDNIIKVKCKNGNFIGKRKNDVCVFKGIPYAQPPVEDLRWKAPIEPLDSDDTYEAFEYGDSAVQYEWFSELASYNKKSEDCLTLNIWTGSTDVSAKKPVMVWIHGGAYMLGGSSDRMYDGQNFAEAHKDIVFVTINYRLGMMGFIDFSKVEGGEEFPDSQNLGLLDVIQALKWIKNNIKNFGGDSENITIFGESAGSVTVGALMIMEEARGLFHKGIQQSGPVIKGITLGTREKSQKFAAKVMELSGCKNMKELMALSTEELQNLETEYQISDYGCGAIVDDIHVPSAGEDALAQSWGSEVDLIIGTNADEQVYSVNECGGIDKFKDYTLERFNHAMTIIADEFKPNVEKFFNLHYGKEEIWKFIALVTEYNYRMPSIIEADLREKHKGKTYMYYWNIPSNSADYYYKACHAVELAYVFNNLDNTIFCGEGAKQLNADRVQEAWVNFAKTGNPSIDGAEWPEYKPDTRITMVIDEQWHTERDLLKRHTDLIMPIYQKYRGSFSFK